MINRKKFVIIDGNNICYRSFYALPILTNFEGIVSNAVFGFAKTIVKIIEDFQPDYMAVAFDKGKNTFRHKMYNEYKAQRKPTPPELISQFPLLKEMLDTMHIKYIELDEIEADDIIGVLSRKYNTENIIVSADKDVLQLINWNTSVYSPKKGNDGTMFTGVKLKEVMGLEPYQIVELKSLMGDPSDNIPGVEGFGEKTAMALLNRYENLDNIYERMIELTPKQQAKLTECKEMAYLSKTLATIKTDYDIPVELESFTFDYPFGVETYDFFKRFQFNSLLKKHIYQNIEEGGKKVKAELKCVNDRKVANEILDKLNNAKVLSIYINDLYASFFDGESEYNFAIAPTLLDDYILMDTICEKLKGVLEDENVPKYFYEAKSTMRELYKFGANVKGLAFDCVIAKYLINSGMKALDFDKAVLYYDLTEGYFARNVSEMVKILIDKLKQDQLDKLYYEVELPLIPVLLDMEIAGVCIDMDELKVLDEKYTQAIKDLTEDIYVLAGSRFNINSPKQLGEILFDNLGLKSRSNKKESTKQAILNELIGQHPIVQKVLDYRQYYKLYSTYIKVYEEVTKEDGKVHTIFNQALTTTGRLSSTEPNLQNIPTRSNEGKALRKIFVPSTPGGHIISADYSQIELRLLANFSGDDKLIEAYNAGIDIHTLTASEMFGVPLQMISADMRRNAKAINFGIIYGISDWGLSQNIGITKADAGKYIKKYFEKYPTIEKYMNDNVEYAKQNGYVKTIMGRIRYIPDLLGNKIQQLFGERVAMNMPLQGSAADIIKMAMVKVHNAFIANNLSSKLILQVHDELVVDAVAGEEEKVIEILKNCMENVIDLDIKLTVNVSIGANLSEAK